MAVVFEGIVADNGGGGDTLTVTADIPAPTPDLGEALFVFGVAKYAAADSHIQLRATDAGVRPLRYRCLDTGRLLLGNNWQAFGALSQAAIGDTYKYVPMGGWCSPLDPLPVGATITLARDTGTDDIPAGYELFQIARFSGVEYTTGSPGKANTITQTRDVVSGFIEVTRHHDNSLTTTSGNHNWLAAAAAAMAMPLSSSLGVACHSMLGLVVPDLLASFNLATGQFEPIMGAYDWGAVTWPFTNIAEIDGTNDHTVTDGGGSHTITYPWRMTFGYMYASDGEDVSWSDAADNALGSILFTNGDTNPPLPGLLKVASYEQWFNAGLTIDSDAAGSLIAGVGPDNCTGGPPHLSLRFASGSDEGAIAEVGDPATAVHLAKTRFKAAE